MTYLGAAPTTTASRKSQTTYRYLCTAGQSVISGSDLNNNTLSCDPLDTEVFMNGLKLDSTDTTITATQVTLAVAAAAGDEIEVVAYRTFESADHYDKSTSDTRYVNTTGDTMSGDLTVGSSGFFVDVSDDVVGVGTTSPATPISKFGGSAKGLAVKAGQPTVAVEASANSQYVGYLGQASTNTYLGALGGGSLIMQTGTSGTTRMTINADGYVTKPNQPSFSAYRDAGHVTSGNVFVFDHTHFNRGNMYDTSNGRGTAPVAGKYLVTCWFMTRNDATYDNKYIRLRINGANPAHKNIYSSSGGAVHHQFSWSGVILLGANDYVDFYVENLSIYGDDSKYSSFCMHLLD